MNEILLPVLIVAGIGLLCGLGLAIASIVMAVPKDEKAEAIEEILPGANCGACGYSGCAGYAKALSSGEAPVGLCSPGGAAVAAATAELLGVAAGEVEYKTALVHCMGSHDNTTDRMKYQGIAPAPPLSSFTAVSPPAPSDAWGWATAPPCVSTTLSRSATVSPALIPLAARAVPSAYRPVLSI